MILCADVLEGLASLPSGLADCCVTSPPYWGLRDYGHDEQIGLEPTPDLYVARLVEVFREVRRVLRADGTLWLNLGDSYANDGKWGGYSGGKHAAGLHGDTGIGRGRRATGLKPKDLVGIPWRVAFALQADGWWLRSDIVWHKPNPMPESITDRPTKAHEYLFLLAKSERYHYDHGAVREPLAGNHPPNHPRTAFDNARPAAGLPPGASPHKGLRRYRSGNAERRVANGDPGHRPSDHLGASVPWVDNGTGRSRRSVWTITTQPYRGAHFAVMPEALVEPCVLAGSRPGGVVLDPFAGSGTTGKVAIEHGRRPVMIERSPAYCAMARRRMSHVQRNLLEASA